MYMSYRYFYTKVIIFPLVASWSGVPLRGTFVLQVSTLEEYMQKFPGNSISEET